MSKLIEPLRGVHDVLPSQVAAWQFLERTTREVFESYGYEEFRVPIIEQTQLFKRSIGDFTDIVEKEMFSFVDQGEDHITLRPEATAGIARAMISNGLVREGRLKVWCMGPMFRRERPQAGRYRQFHQIDAEAFGFPGPDIDAEMILLSARLLRRLGLTGLKLLVNSLGTPEVRAVYRDLLIAYFAGHEAALDEDSKRRLKGNPQRILDSKNPDMQSLIAGAPSILDALDAESKAHFEELCGHLRSAGIAYDVEPRLVRGLDYYTRTAFEFTHGALGAQNAILGGGRYDGLSEALGGPAAPGIGFAIGEDRLVMSLQESASAAGALRRPDVYVASLGAGMNAEAARLARELRRHDLVVDLGDDTFRLKKSFETATKAGAKYILIVGENEVKAEAFALKNLSTGEQVSVPRAELAKKIQE